MLTLSALTISRKRIRHYSQWGEDGVLDYVLSKLPIRDNYLVEFGAWDGKYLSNSFYFIENYGYTGVLIEMNAERYKELEINMKAFQSICIHAAVGYEGDSSLDFILRKTEIPKDFDLLSIDIDGKDYQVWDALIEYQPKVVIIEINASVFPGKVEVNNPDQPFELFVSGSSISAITHLAESKGYGLIANVGCNAIFVRKEFYGLYHSKLLTEYDLFTYEAFGNNQLRFSQKFHALLFTIYRPNLIRRLLQTLARKVKSIS
jgi:hypothetical protein